MKTAAELYLIMEQGPGSEAALSAVLSGTDVASVLIQPAPGSVLDASTTKRLVSAIQNHGAVALIADDANMARMLKADGVHLTWDKEQEARYGAARDILGPRFVVGVDAGRSRHDAMTVGEAGADYVAFGIPAHVEDRQTAIARRLELILWWAEIFEVPCVATDVDTIEEARHLVAAGADFVSAQLPAGITPEGAKAWIADFAAMLAPGKVTQ